MEETAIITYPNQKVVLIEKYSDTQKGESYTVITERERIIASRLLNDKSASLILWLYLAGNQGGYSLALSPKAIQDLYGISEKQYRKAIDRLETTGYLVQNGNSTKEWLFKALFAWIAVGHTTEV